MEKIKAVLNVLVDHKWKSLLFAVIISAIAAKLGLDITYQDVCTLIGGC